MRAVALLLLTSLPLPSCLEMQQTITIAADGSGTQRLQLSTTEAVLAEAGRAMAVTAPEGGTAPRQLFEQQAVQKELEAAGLRLVAYETGGDAGRRQVSLQVAFASPAELRRSPLLGGRAEWEFAAGPRPGTVRIALYLQGRSAWLQARAQAEALARGADPTAASFFDKRKQQLQGLDVQLRLQLPGKVLQWTRTLERTGDCEVLAKVSAAEIKTPEDLVRKLAPRFEVVIDASGLKLPLDG